MNPLLRWLSGAVGVAATALGLVLAYECYFLYFLGAKNPDYRVPLWESLTILVLFVAAVVLLMFAAYKLLVFAVAAKK